MSLSKSEMVALQITEHIIGTYVDPSGTGDAWEKGERGQTLQLTDEAKEVYSDILEIINEVEGEMSE